MDSVDDTAAQLAKGVSYDEEIQSDSCSFLVVIIDLHSNGWLKSQISLWKVLESLTVFLNAHLALNSSNELAVLGFNGLGARVLYSTTTAGKNADANDIANGIHLKGTMIRQFKKFDESVLSSIKAQIAEAKAKNVNGSTSVSGPLSLALSHLNRRIREKSSMRGHILIVSASGDDMGSKYIATMNTIFTAQKLGVPLDVANFGPPKSFLQQAAEFTQGSYLEFSEKDAEGLVHYFCSTFLVEPAVRKYVNMATKSNVDFSAVCFITKKILEIGYVCSVCLCIMQEIPEDNKCAVCHSQYE